MPSMMGAPDAGQQMPDLSQLIQQIQDPNLRQQFALALAMHQQAPPMNATMGAPMGGAPGMPPSGGQPQPGPGAGGPQGPGVAGMDPSKLMAMMPLMSQLFGHVPPPVGGGGAMPGGGSGAGPRPMPAMPGTQAPAQAYPRTPDLGSILTGRM